MAAMVVLPQADLSIKKKFKSKNYTVTWASVPNFPSSAQLEVGYGNGHGGTLRWLKFQPREDGVQVLSIEFDEGWHPYESKWQPDLAPVTVKKGVMPDTTYASLLRQIAVVSSARLKPILRNSAEHTSSDFWVSTRLKSHDHLLLDSDWAGYWNSLEEFDFAKPNISVSLTREAVSKNLWQSTLLTRKSDGG